MGRIDFYKLSRDPVQKLLPALAARLLDQPAKALKPRWVYRENDAGLLLACGWVDEMIMDDAPFRGVRIDEIRMGAAPAGSTKN